MYLVLPFVWTSKLLPVTTIRPFRVTVESVLLYGSETWTVTKKLEKSVNGCYTRMLGTAVHVHWRQHMNNQELYRSLPRVSETICARRLRLAATVHVTMKTIKMLFQKRCFGNPNMVTQIEVDLELHTLTPSRPDTGLDNTKEIRHAMLDQVVWKYFIRTARDDSRLR